MLIRKWIDRLRVDLAVGCQIKDGGVSSAKRSPCERNGNGWMEYQRIARPQSHWRDDILLATMGAFGGVLSHSSHCRLRQPPRPLTLPTWSVCLPLAGACQAQL